MTHEEMSVDPIEEGEPTGGMREWGAAKVILISGALLYLVATLLFWPFFYHRSTPTKQRTTSTSSQHSMSGLTVLL